MVPVLKGATEQHLAVSLPQKSKKGEGCRSMKRRVLQYIVSTFSRLNKESESFCASPVVKWMLEVQGSFRGNTSQVVFFLAQPVSQEATRPFSRINRARTAHLLMAREKRSRLEVEKAQNASLNERGIDESLTQEMRGLNVGCGLMHAKNQLPSFWNSYNQR